MEPFATELELVELLMRTYADEEPTVVADAIFCFAEEQKNVPSVVETGTQIWKTGKAQIVVIDDFSDFPKYELENRLLRQMLIEKGVPEEAIVKIPHPSDFPFPHTQTESIGLIRYAKEHGWRTIYITAVPSRLLRSFIAIITAVLREYPELKVYSRVGAILPWSEFAVHSQGTIQGKRYEIIKSELTKVHAYHLKDDQISAREALDYLNTRSEQKP